MLRGGLLGRLLRIEVVELERGCWTFTEAIMGIALTSRFMDALDYSS